jgi:NADH-quinone oxidoreductase subunit H
MRLGWKVFLPMSLLFVALISGYLMATGHFERNSILSEEAPAVTPTEIVNNTPAQPDAVRGQS